MKLYFVKHNHKVYVRLTKSIYFPSLPLAYRCL